jgi:hypothetical protein
MPRNTVAVPAREFPVLAKGEQPVAMEPYPEASCGHSGGFHAWNGTENSLPTVGCHAPPERAPQARFWRSGGTRMELWVPMPQFRQIRSGRRIWRSPEWRSCANNRNRLARWRGLAELRIAGYEFHKLLDQRLVARGLLRWRRSCRSHVHVGRRFDSRGNHLPLA